MKIFTVGPVEMYQDTLQIGGEQLPYFRTDHFSEIIFEIEKNFLTLLNAPSESKIALLTASGTGAMEAAVLNSLCKNDKVLIIDGGGFGTRFVELCNLYGIKNTPLQLSYNEPLTKEKLYSFNNHGYTALLVNIHETTTGQLYDAEMLGQFCKENNMIFIVDAISSFLADPFDMSSNGADIVLTSSQKALALSPGLSIITVSPKMAQIIKKRKIKSMYFNLNDYFLNMGHGQTPFTPAVGTILQLSQRLKTIISDGGAATSIESIQEKATFFRTLCNNYNLHYTNIPLSNTLTPLIFYGNAKHIFDTMRNNYGLMLTPNGGKLADTILRVGHIGNINKKDLQLVADKIAEIIK